MAANIDLRKDRRIYSEEGKVMDYRNEIIAIRTAGTLREQWIKQAHISIASNQWTNEVVEHKLQRYAKLDPQVVYDTRYIELKKVSQGSFVLPWALTICVGVVAMLLLPTPFFEMVLGAFAINSLHSLIKSFL